MKLELIKPVKALNKAYLKEKVSRNHIELFKKNLQQLLTRINEQESEEHLKNVISDFLKDTYYKEQFEINTKHRNDLVIHTGKTTKEPVGVILEVKKPSNKSEMITDAKANVKALQELILYFLRERLEHANTDIKYLVITNIYEWYIMDEVWFEKNVFRNTKLKRDYENWKLSGKDTKFFYDSIANSFLDDVNEEMPAAYFDLRTYEKYVTNIDKEDDTKLIGLYKILSPAHLLKQPFTNDSNSLDTKFYTELLHIIGLEEIKDGNKKLIKRKSKPDEASLLENTIIKLEDKDALRNINNLSTFGISKEEQLFNVALELCITWINRVLFIKLLEAQLYKYHKGNKDYLFFNSKLVHDFDELSNLFFQVLAEKPGSRRNHIQEKFSKVPYLNSSLFERIELERQTINISELDNRLQLPLSTSSVLKDDKGKRKTGALHTLQYLFEFLDAYDFTSEGGEEIQEENKNLINASVLGLIFEKINGYKDGSFFTPGFVTMYMCKETIRRSVLQKFNDTKGWNCDTIDNLYNKIDDKKEANKIINNIHICDPAVGSGHFLVSALNEIIAIKSELKILQDATGKSLRDYHVEVVNDELIIIDEDGKLFDYNMHNKESQRIQETLFHEKETIIENCLFGVDINPNSVKICRLRLWIELLKNAYYTPSSNYTELETLPNIDINIKCGNSLISRFALDVDIKSTLRSTKKWDIDSYKQAVQTYREAESKEQKRAMEELIDSIKKDFRSYISPNDPKYKKLSKLRGDLFKLSQIKDLFDEGNKKNKDPKKKIEELTNNIKKLEIEIEEIKSNKIYENAFEWRFEFPEVLNEYGDFIGFDVVIGNPPYGIEISEILKNWILIQFTSKTDSYQLFALKAFQLTKNRGYVSQIIPNSWMSRKAGIEFRNELLKKKISILINFGQNVFEDAGIDTCICIIQNQAFEDAMVKTKHLNKPSEVLNIVTYNLVPFIKWLEIGKISCSLGINEYLILEKIIKKSLKLKQICNVTGGYKPYQVGYGKSIYGDFSQTKEDIANRVYHAHKKMSEEYYPDIKGSNINKYHIIRNTQWVKWGPWLMSPKKKENFLNPKLVVREITGDGLITAFDDQGYFTNDTTHMVLHKSISTLKYLNAILNSKLMGWFFKKYFGEENEMFPKVKVNEIEELPIIDLNEKDQEPFVESIDKILDNMKNGSKERISLLEMEIDSLVYQLYDLTDIEIKLIEHK
jgi:adenine-specific DNA-methyltransferase